LEGTATGNRVSLTAAISGFKVVLILMFCAYAKLPSEASVVNTMKMRFFSTGFLVDLIQKNVSPNQRLMNIELFFVSLRLSLCRKSYF
jgi:hypothetical protein